MAVLAASVSAAEVSKSTCSGNLTSARSGTPTFSANPPSRCTPSSRPLRQSDSSPRAQNSHSPQNKLDCTATRSPIRHLPHARAERGDLAGHLASRNARQGRRSGQAPFLHPQIQAVQSAGPDFDHDLARRGHRIGNVAEDQLARRAMREELNRFHIENNGVVARGRG